MFGPLGQILMLMTLTTGLRTLSRWVGPRRSGLILGLPSTTALVLLGCGLERGVDEATVVAEACLAGLLAAVTLPVAFARAIGAGWRLPRSIAAAVSGYLIVATGLWWLPGLGPIGSLAGAVLGVLLACALVARTSAAVCDVSESHAVVPSAHVRLRCLATRAAVPAIYVVVIRTLRWLAGPGWSGRFVTFPGGSLALLVATHVEAGPASARRLAAAMPSGSFGTLAFLAVFRHFGPSLGLGWATLAGYAAALSALLTVELTLMVIRAARRLRIRPFPVASLWASLHEALSPRIESLTVAWHRGCDTWTWPHASAQRRDALRRFAPGLECLTG